jgi:hypothetical protein
VGANIQNQFSGFKIVTVCLFMTYFYILYQISVKFAGPFVFDEGTGSLVMRVTSGRVAPSFQFSTGACFAKLRPLQELTLPLGCRATTLLPFSLREKHRHHGMTQQQIFLIYLTFLSVPQII